MKKNLTELVFILDRSGSMHGMESDTVGGFNSFIEKQKGEDGRAYVTTVLFSTSNLKLHDRLDIREVAPLSEREYYVGGCTALYDAIGDTVEHISTVHRYIREEDLPEKTIFVITTDGYENASHKYSAAAIRQKIKERESLGWEFLFLGANIDAFAAADDIGIRRSRATKYCAAHTDTMFDTVSSAVSYCRRVGSVKDDWADGIDPDD